MNKSSKKPKGRGLGVLLGGDGENEEIFDVVGEIERIGKTSSDDKKVVMIKTVDIEPNSSQPRKNFDEEKLEALSRSIKEHGLVQPILVTPTNAGTYKIVAGERRWRASKLAEIKEIPCIIRDFDGKEVAELALVENLQREDLNAIEEAEGYRRLTEVFDMTQDEIGKKVGKSRSAVANSMRLNALSDKIKQMVIEEKLTQGHARALLAVSDENMRDELAERIIKDGLNVRQAEALAASVGKEKKNERKPISPMTLKYYKDAENNLSSRLGTKVKISEGAKKGKIEIEYYSKDDLERLLFEIYK